MHVFVLVIYVILAALFFASAACFVFSGNILKTLQGAIAMLPTWHWMPGEGGVVLHLAPSLESKFA